MATNSQVVKPRIERAHNGCRPDLYSLSTVLKAVLQTNVGLVAHIEKEGGNAYTVWLWEKVRSPCIVYMLIQAS